MCAVLLHFFFFKAGSSGESSDKKTKPKGAALFRVLLAQSGPAISGWPGGGMTVREARTHVGASQANTSTGITHKCRLCGAQEEGRDRGTPVPPDHQLELNKPRLQTQTQADRHSACGSFTFLLTLPWKQLKCLC